MSFKLGEGERLAEGRLFVDHTEATLRRAMSGLLLAAHLDALFDKCLITFTNVGEMLISPTVSAADRIALAIPARLRRIPSAEEMAFLDYHHEHVFKA
jgi:hypothetical protein